MAVDDSHSLHTSPTPFFRSARLGQLRGPAWLLASCQFREVLRFCPQSDQPDPKPYVDARVTLNRKLMQRRMPPYQSSNYPEFHVACNRSPPRCPRESPEPVEAEVKHWRRARYAGNASST